MKKVEVNPTAKIAVKKNVVKHYQVDGQNSVFLPKDSEFEIELFNPTTDVIMCRISLNGNEDFEGLILSPGERVFLDRYLSENKKFKFETYKVEDGNKEVDNAIKFNGLIKVDFFKELTWTYNYTYSPYDNVTTWNNNPTPWYGTTTGGAGITNTGYYYSEVSTFTNSVPKEVTLTSSNLPEEKETGRIAKGSESNQKLSYVDKNFNYTPFYTETIKILPDSEKIATSADLKYKKYCSNCGKKVNQKDHYCSYCGNKLN